MEIESGRSEWEKRGERIKELIDSFFVPGRVMQQKGEREKDTLDSQREKDKSRRERERESDVVKS